MNNFDVVVIGAGPGGYVAAIRATQLGMKTAIIEREHLGGVCLNWGCIPTKALLCSAELYQKMKHLSEFGLKADNIDFDFNAIVKRSRDVASRLNTGVKHLLKKNDVTVFDGFGRLNGHTVLVEKDGEVSTELSAKHIILATGAKARSLPNMEADGEYIWDYKNAMNPSIMPASIVVVGSGAIGIEFASFYNALGVKVTVVEVVDRILPLEDDEVSTFVQRALKRQGIKFLTGASVKQVEKKDGEVTVSFERKGKENTLTAEKMIVAVGIETNLENIGLETTSVRIEKGHICVNEWLETDDAGIYAIGDIVAPPWLAHKASHEAVICIEKIAGVENVKPLDYENIPSCIYCNPQVASMGLTEKQAVEKGYNVKVGNFPYAGNGKAVAIGEPKGFIKTVFDADTDKILGVHMVGAEVTEMIAGLSIAKDMDATAEAISHVVFPHPSLSETIHESVLHALDKAIHI